MKRVLLCGIAAVAAGTAGATPADDTGAWFVSPLVQYVHLSNNRDGENGVGYQFGIGYNFAPQWVGEVTYNSGSFTSHSGPDIKLKNYSFEVARKFMPESLVRPYVLLGVGDITDQLRGSGQTSTLSAQGGAGILWALGSQTGPTRLQFRTEAKYRREFIGHTTYGAANPGDVLFGAGLVLSWGNPTPVVAQYVPPPAPQVIQVAAVVAPPPPPPPAPAPVVPKHVTFDADTLFTFNTSALRPEGDRALDTFAEQLKTTTFTQVRVLGYTDRIGSDAYNQRLSQRRADTVKAYLVNSAGVNGDKILAEGRGKSDPVTQPGQCGAKRSAATIACLQPDRRVDIEVDGILR